MSQTLTNTEPAGTHTPDTHGITLHGSRGTRPPTSACGAVATASHSETQPRTRNGRETDARDTSRAEDREDREETQGQAPARAGAVPASHHAKQANCLTPLRNAPVSFADCPPIPTASAPAVKRVLRTRSTAAGLPWLLAAAPDKNRGKQRLAHGTTRAAETQPGCKVRSGD